MFYVNGVSLHCSDRPREINMFHVTRAAFDLIPGMEHHRLSDQHDNEFWVKTTTIGLGHNKIMLTVFCDEPPSINPSFPSASIGNLNSTENSAERAR